MGDKYKILFTPDEANAFFQELETFGVPMAPVKRIFGYGCQTKVNHTTARYTG